jgi:uncharacterized protein (TIGR03083 family)
MRTLSNARLLDSLDGDFRRLHDLAGDDLTAPVPTCPEWTLKDLVEHVATVYLHKAETMRLGEFPKDWPPQRAPEAPAAYLQRAYAALTEEFSARNPDDTAATWFEPDQTVGFWIRRMAHESVIHRVDAELAVGTDQQPIATDVAVDGTDEVLKGFLPYATTAWPEDFEGVLPAGGETALVRAGDAAWLVTVGDSVTVAHADPQTPADVTLSGDPSAVLLWVWRRAAVDTVVEQGRSEVTAKLRDLLRISMQ